MAASLVQPLLAQKNAILWHSVETLLGGIVTVLKHTGVDALFFTCCEVL